jgi:hypothetical protein
MMMVDGGRPRHKNQQQKGDHRRLQKLAPNAFFPTTHAQLPERHVLYPYPYGSSTVRGAIGWILHRRLVRRLMGHHGQCTFCLPRAVSQQPAVVLHSYSMTTTLSLGEGVAAQIMMGHHGTCPL